MSAGKPKFSCVLFKKRTKKQTGWGMGQPGFPYKSRSISFSISLLNIFSFVIIDKVSAFSIHPNGIVTIKDLFNNRYRKVYKTV